MKEMPRFPGCEGKGSLEEVKKCANRALTTFLYKNLKYPTLAREHRVEGMCMVQFTVEKDGSVSDVTLLRDIGGGCGEESVRVVELMNKEGIKWIPGPSRGRACRVRFTMPIKFKLDYQKPKMVEQVKLPVKPKEKTKISSSPKASLPKPKIQIQQFSLSPNPSNGQFQLQFKAKPISTTVLIYNSLSQVVYKEHLDEFDGYYQRHIDIQNQGMYLVRLEQNNQSFSQQFLIIKN